MGSSWSQPQLFNLYDERLPGTRARNAPSREESARRIVERRLRLLGGLSVAEIVGQGGLHEKMVRQALAELVEMGRAEPYWFQDTRKWRALRQRGERT